MSETEYRVRILHVSDLHAGAGDEKDSWRRRRVLGDAWRRNLDALLTDGPIDLVCFTGDVANWGLAAEYAAAGEFVDDLLRQLALPRERFFVVPGNHHIHRNTEPAAWERLWRDLGHVDPHEISAWLTHNKAPRGFDRALLDQVLARGAAYRDWLKALGREALLPERSRHGRLGYAVRVELPGRPFAIIEKQARSGVLWTLANVAHRGGALERALAAAEEKERLDQERGDPRGAALAAGARADILQDRGQLDEALRIRREEVLPALEHLGARHDLVQAHLRLARLHLQRDAPGDAEAAQKLLQTALADADAMRIPEAEAIRALLAQQATNT